MVSIFNPYVFMNVMLTPWLWPALSVMVAMETAERLSDELSGKPKMPIL